MLVVSFYPLNLNFILAQVFLLGTAFVHPVLWANDQYTLSSQRLSKIIEAENRFFDLSKGVIKPSDQELTRKAQEIVASYESYLGENPKDTHALILFGKFLDKVGQQGHAVNYFLEADTLNPRLAVVKQQIGNYLIEEGRPVDAFPFLVLTLEIEPQQPAYHFHLANYLFLFEDEVVQAEIMDEEALKSFMHDCFGKASSLSPGNFDYHLRFAQSFFDYPRASRNEALQVWDNLISNFPLRSKSEKDYFKLCKGRILLELDRDKEAVALIESVSTTALTNTKLSLLEQAKPSKKSPPLEIPQDQQESKPGAHIQILPDPHLDRLNEVTSRLKEERLLGQLRIDALRAHLDGSGKIQVDFSSRSILVD